ncbi:Histone deacetylase complex subunit [Coemansia sp. S680]|nr:Histone deacetylase complex subunit [Coemansia sp. S680]
MPVLLDLSDVQRLQEHLPLCGLRPCLPSYDGNHRSSDKLGYSKSHFMASSSIVNYANSSSIDTHKLSSPLLTVYSEATSYNDVLSTGIWLASSEDAKPISLSTYAANSPTKHSNVKQENDGPSDAAGGDNESEQSSTGPGQNGDFKESDSKQTNNRGGQDSEDNGASGEKSDDGSGDDGSDDDDEDEDDGVVRCVCGERNDGELMIQCEICQVWQHTLCMGIRDEAHIPDKYYCEKCHPQDHPFINSRPRTMVLAEASAIGASTMMRRSAVMAVAKMTAREEYRSASAAAAIAASVAAAATQPAGGKSTGANSRRSSAKKPATSSARKAEGSNGAQKSSRRAPRRNRRSQRGTDGNGVDGSEDDYDESKPIDTPGTGGLGNSGASRADGDESADRPKNGRRSSNAAAMNSPLSARKAQTPKRTAAGQGSGGGKRRKVAGNRTSGESPNMELTPEDGLLPNGGDAFAEDLVARMMSAGKSGTPKAQRNRSISTLAGTGALEAGSQKRRGKSEPGSPTQLSPSPPVFSADCGEISTGADYPENNETPGSGEQQQQRSVKRKRTGVLGRSNSKHLRMTVSAANSPSLGDGASAFGLFAEGSGGSRSAMVHNEDGACSAEGDDSHVVQRQLKHNFPPLETEDVDGNRITVPSSMLNSQGQPIYSSVAADTMCKIRYPHGRASLYELNRRAKNMLEWLGKAQSEYEHERLSWLPPLSQRGANSANPMASALQELVPSLSQPNGEPSGGRLAMLVRDSSHQLSDAPTSPINPSDWPTDENYDGEQGATDLANAASSGTREAEAGDQNRPRSTLSMMEDLVWRLIRFQETYSN